MQGNTLEEVAHRCCQISIPGDPQSSTGWVPEKPDKTGSSSKQGAGLHNLNFSDLNYSMIILLYMPWPHGHGGFLSAKLPDRDLPGNERFSLLFLQRQLKSYTNFWNGRPTSHHPRNFIYVYIWKKVATGIPVPTCTYLQNDRIPSGFPNCQL